MRDTPSCLPASATASTTQRPIQPRYMQFLFMSYYSAHGFIYTSSSEGPNQTQDQNQNQNQSTPDQSQPPNQDQNQNQDQMIMTTTPHQSYTTLFHHFIYACQPFWCHRHTVTVPSGLVYDVGDFRVRIGDVRQTQPAARVRGTVVVVEWRGPSVISTVSTSNSMHRDGKQGPGEGDGDVDSGIDMDVDMGVGMASSDISESDIDSEYVTTAALIRDFWARLGVDGAREAILVPGLGKEVKERLRRWKLGNDRGDDAEVEVGGVDEARQFMEIFRFNR